MDFLEHNAVDDVIILSVVLDEVKHKNQSVYQRLRALCASPSRRFFVFANENHRCVYNRLTMLFRPTTTTNRRTY